MSAIKRHQSVPTHWRWGQYGCFYPRISLALKSTVQERIRSYVWLRYYGTLGMDGPRGEKGLVGPSTRPASPLSRASNNKHPLSLVSPPLKPGHYLGKFCQSHLFEDFPLKASSVPFSGEAQPRGDLSNLPLLGRNRWAPGGGPPPRASLQQLCCVQGEGDGVGTM